MKTVSKYATEYADEFVKLTARYDGLKNYVRQMGEGKVRSLIVNGPAGVGKTYNVNAFLTEYCPNQYKSVSGHITMLSLYAALYAHRNEGQVLVLDDTDGVFSKVDGLNLLKAAMDTKASRDISWESSSAMLGAMGLPNRFEFKGAVILITNVGFDTANKKANKLTVHLNALKDRAFVVHIADRGLDSQFQQLCYMVVKHNVFAQFRFDSVVADRLLDYVRDNLKQLHTVSIRTLIKLGGIYEADPKNWRALADQGLLVS